MNGVTTLDEEERSLDPPMLAIADSQDAIALAGVMGGQNTEVGDSTTNVLIESANFDATNTRNTSVGLGMRTEASYRFERGIRQDLVPRALRRATALMLELAGGSRCEGDHRRIPRGQDTADTDDRTGAVPARARHGLINRYDRRSVDLVGL